MRQRDTTQFQRAMIIKLKLEIVLFQPSFAICPSQEGRL